MKTSLKKAVKKYLASEEFQHKLTDYEADGFFEGFMECHLQICKLYPDLDINELKEVYDDDGDD